MRLAGPLAHVLTGLLDGDPSRRLTADEAAWHLRAITEGPQGTPPPIRHAPPYGSATGPQAAYGSQPMPASAPGSGPGPHPPQGTPGHDPGFAPGPYGSRAGTMPSPKDEAAKGGRGPKASVLLGAALAIVLLAAAGLTVWRVWDSGRATTGATGGTTGGATSGGGAMSGPVTTDPTLATLGTGKAVYAREPRACDMISVAQASRLLGAQAKAQFHTRGSCSWQTTSGPFMSIQIARFQDDAVARLAFEQIRTTNFEEEVERNPGTRLRRDLPKVGAEAISFRRSESLGNITQVLFRHHNLTVLLYLSSKSSGFTRIDQASAIVVDNLDRAR